MECQAPVVTAGGPDLLELLLKKKKKKILKVTLKVKG